MFNSVCADSHLLSPIEVELDVEVFNEGGDGVPVGVGLFLDDPDQVFHDLVPPGGLVDDDGGGKVSQDPRAGRLDGVEVLPLVQEQLDRQVTALKKPIRHLYQASIFARIVFFTRIRSKFSNILSMADEVIIKSKLAPTARFAQMKSLLAY